MNAQSPIRFRTAAELLEEKWPTVSLEARPDAENDGFYLVEREGDLVVCLRGDAPLRGLTRFLSSLHPLGLWTLSAVRGRE